jgi:hypothetical protein
MRATILAGAACALLLSACGGSGAGTPPPAPVRLAVTAPGDLRTVRAATVQVQGTVRPASATVTVGGRPAAVAGGTFRATVGLTAGINVIDVLASDGAARPAATAVRVRRVVAVAVPVLTGQKPDDARRQLEALGLKADTQQSGGGFFDQLLGNSPKVCATDPPAGTQVDAGATVHVTVAPGC